MAVAKPGPDGAAPGTPALVMPLVLNLSGLSKAGRKELWSRMDVNGGGTLSYGEIEAGIGKQFLNLARSKRPLMVAYKAANGGDGLVNRSEFPRLLQLIDFFVSLWSKFEEIDNGDAKLDIEEFSHALDVIEAEEVSIDDSEKFFKEMDGDANGYVSFDEFCTWMALRHCPAPNTEKIVAPPSILKVPLELVFECSGLGGSLDTQAVLSTVTKMPANRRGKREISLETVGKTEIVRWCSCPKWTEFIDVGMREGDNTLTQQMMAVSIIHVNTKGHLIRELGSAVFGLHELYHARWRRMTLQCAIKKKAGQDAEVDASGPVITVTAVQKAHVAIENKKAHGLWIRTQFEVASIVPPDKKLSLPTYNGAVTTATGSTNDVNTSTSSRRGGTEREKGGPQQQLQQARNFVGDVPKPDPTADEVPVPPLLSAIERSARPDREHAELNTYLQISRHVQGFLQPIYRSEVIMGTAHPQWKDHAVSWQKLCVCNPDCTIVVSLYATEQKVMADESGRDKTVKICEQRPDLLLGEVFLTVDKIATGARFHAKRLANSTKAQQEEMQHRRRANYYGAIHKEQDMFPLVRFFDKDKTKYLGGWLTCIQFERYYPDRGTSRTELHLEDKHFAEDREFLSELMLQDNKNVLTGDVTDKVDMARRYVEQCCQHWLTLRKDEKAAATRQEKLVNARRQAALTRAARKRSSWTGGTLDEENAAAAAEAAAAAAAVDLSNSDSGSEKGAGDAAAIVATNPRRKRMARNQIVHSKALRMNTPKKEFDLDDICLPDSKTFDPLSKKKEGAKPRFVSKKERMKTIGLAKYRRELWVKHKARQEKADKDERQDNSQMLEDTHVTARNVSAQRDPKKNPTLARVMSVLKKNDGVCTYAQMIEIVDSSTWRKRPEGETADALVWLRVLKKLNFVTTAEKNHRSLYDGHDPPSASGQLSLPVDAAVLISVVPETGNHMIRDDDKHTEHYSKLQEHGDEVKLMTSSLRSRRLGTGKLRPPPMAHISPRLHNRNNPVRLDIAAAAKRALQQAAASVGAPSVTAAAVVMAATTTTTLVTGDAAQGGTGTPAGTPRSSIGSVRGASVASTRKSFGGKATSARVPTKRRPLYYVPQRPNTARATGRSAASKYDAAAGRSGRRLPPRASVSKRDGGGNRQRLEADADGGSSGRDSNAAGDGGGGAIGGRIAGRRYHAPASAQRGKTQQQGGALRQRRPASAPAPGARKPQPPPPAGRNSAKPSSRAAHTGRNYDAGSVDGDGADGGDEDGSDGSLLEWLASIGAAELHQMFIQEGFTTLRHVQRARLTASDLTVLGFRGDESVQAALSSLQGIARMHAESAAYVMIHGKPRKAEGMAAMMMSAEPTKPQIRLGDDVQIRHHSSDDDPD